MNLPGYAAFTQSMADEGWEYDKNRKVWQFVGIKPTVQERLADLPATTQALVDGIADQFV